MSILVTLATELILAIISHLPRPDKLRLVLVNRKLYHMVIPQLYKHITLDQTRVPSNRDDFTQTDRKACWDTFRLRRLCNFLRDKPLTHSPVVESLSLQLDSNTLHESFQLSNIMCHLPNLKSFCLSSKRSPRDEGRPTLSDVSPLFIRWNLRGVSGTLESLILDIDQDIDFRDGTDVGCLKSFKALKHLSIQSHVFFGEFGGYDDRSVFEESDYYVTRYDQSILAWTLPPRLRKLQMSCWTDGYGEDDHPWGVVVTILLRYLVKWSLDDFPELQDITVYYPPEREGADDAAADPIFFGQEYNDVGDDKPELQRCATEGQWQRVAEMLTKMALNKHRNISVKFEQGKQEGSRAWGETATEPARVGS